MPDETIEYFLATSAINFSGAKTTTKTVHGGKETVTFSSSAALVSRADAAAGALRLTVPVGRFDDRKLSLKFQSDGRLSSSDLTDKGQGAVVLGAVAKFAGTVAGAAIRAASIAAVREEPESPVAQGSTDAGTRHSHLVALRSKLVERQSFLTEQLLEPAGSVGDPTELKGLAKSLKLVAAQLTRVDAEIAAWEGATTATSETYGVIVDLADVPSFDPAVPPKAADFDALLAKSPLALFAAKKLGLVVTFPTANPSHQEPAPSKGIWYRKPRVTRMSTWKVVFDRDDKLAADPVLISVMDVAVVDRACRLGLVPVSKKKLFGTTALSTSFADNGALVSFGDNETSGAAAAISAAAGLTTSFGDGVKDFTTTSGAVAGLIPNADAQDIADLTTQKAKLQLAADVATLEAGGTLPTGS